MKRLAVALMVVGGLLFTGGTVTQADYPPGQEAAIVVTPLQGPPGFTVNAVVTNCYPGEIIEFELGNNGDDVECNSTTFEARADLIAPTATGFHDVRAYLPPAPSGPIGGFLLAFAAPQAVTERPRTLIESIEVTGSRGVPSQQDPDDTSTTSTLVPSATVPATGSNNTGSVTMTGLLLVIAGLAMFAVSRARRAQPA